MKTAILSFMLLLGAVLGAQAYTVKGSVADTNGEPMIRATVKVLAAADSAVVKGDLTDDNGAFSISDIKKGKYLLETSYVGYLPIVVPIEVTKNYDAGQIVLKENDVMLRDITITGIQTPVRVAEDTVEFNAGAFRTQPNAVVEDLLKRLPGVEVNSEGQITHNGRQISKILVDGKEFFGDDPTVASRNIPVDMVDKLQVVDRKSDLARLTGVDDGDDETVINLTVKKGMNQGWFGNLEAGYGTDDRYKGNFIVNRFWNGNQLTFIGGANNVNEMGFSDGGARFRRFGGGNGITTSHSLGVNFNIGNEEIFRVGGDVMYSHTNVDTRTRQDRQYLFTDSTSFFDSQKNSLDKGHNIRADFRVQWNRDSFNTFEFRPNLSLNISDSESDEVSNTHAGRGNTGLVGDQVNRSINRQNSHGNSFEVGGRLIYNHKFRSRKGRAFSLFVNFRSSNMREKANTYSWNKFYLINDSVDLYDQFSNDHTWSNTISSRASWTEPLGDPQKGNFLEFAYQFQYRWNNADKMTYDHPVEWPAGWEGDPVISSQMVWNEDLSNQFRNDYMNQDIRAGYKYVSKEQNLNVGLSLVPQMSRSINLINDDKSIPTRWVWNFAPYMRYRWKMSKSRSMQLNYRGRSSQPSMSQLQPVADMSNPLNIVQGNPNLKPSFSHNMDFRLQDFNMEAQRALMVMLRATVSQNSIVSRTTFSPETGGRYTTYENVNGVWNLNGFTMVSFPFRNKKWTFNNHLGAGYNHNVGYNNGEKNNSGNLSIFESMGIAFRPDNLFLELRPNYRLQTTSNSLQTTANRTVHSFGGTFNVNYFFNFGLSFDSDLTYTANRGYGASYNTNEWMWNATLSYQMLADKSLTLSVSAYDLLQQRSNVQRSVNASYIQDALYNSLTRYFMVTLSWKFNTFGQGNEPADRNRPQFGGPMGPGGPPPGGPRGGRPPR